jgi:hypothetical protein
MGSYKDGDGEVHLGGAPGRGVEMRTWWTTAGKMLLQQI